MQLIQYVQIYMVHIIYHLGYIGTYIVSAYSTSASKLCMFETQDAEAFQLCFKLCFHYAVVTSAGGGVLG